ncbi:hypothetical protein AGRA3207_000570 [Actinomadura graeca]|uniref:Uncharacterized protein n=1 Tax=Actinomadura graeca TaxID=2750812 RepID=A0ABX8QN03_9ACTN|nr:hypothetical protein [Actinomadura graeca]QXJ19953.1 hypothetical protein AGRA3207_000570 [Actinomadura graeca]
MSKRSGDVREGRQGVFVPAEVLVAVVIGAAGLATAVLAALFPAVGLPVGVGVAVVGLLYGIYHNTRQRAVALVPGTPPTGVRTQTNDEEGERHG